MEKIYELTNPQKSIYLMEQYFQNTTVNNICTKIFIKQKVNFDVLNTAINLFIQNNDSFSLRFKQNGTNLVQYFTKEKFINFDIIKIDNEEKIHEIAKNEVNRQFNLLNSRMFNFKLFELPSGFGGFILNIHHIISFLLLQGFL